MRHPSRGSARPLIRALQLLAALLALGWAVAERIEIDAGDDPESRLEIRNVTLPGGAETTLYVVQGRPVTVTIGERQLVAELIEVDLESRVVRMIGFGTFTTPEQTVQGFDLVIELDSESLSGRDVLIITEAIDVQGAEAVRVPGQISVLEGRFSPCSRCGQEVEDYGFRAQRIEIYPGDRLVAFGATLLIRDLAIAELPVLVVPLARPERQPRLSISQGTAREPARVELAWPYVAGADAFGTFSVSYLATVDPAAGGGPLGGRVVDSYLGFGVDHRFYDERGAGTARFDYRPGIIDLTGSSDDPRFTVILTYQTLDDAPVPGLPAIDFNVTRDDDVRERLLEYGLELRGIEGPLAGTLQSQGFVDLDTGDDVDDPSYDDRATPRRTPLRLSLEPVTPTFSVGPLVLTRLFLDLGIFEDASNPTNRSAAALPFVHAGRLVERHALELQPTVLWQGFQLSGFTNFTGHYYTTGERLIDWDTRLAAEQGIFGIGNLAVVFRRDVSEGETPFRFDQLPLNTRTDLQVAFDLHPWPWLDLESRSGYVFRDSRRPELQGIQPVETTVTLFGNLTWLDLAVTNRYDIEEGDPGNLRFQADLRTPEGPPRAELTVVHTQDLAILPDRLTGVPTDETVTTFDVSYGVDLLSLDASGGFRYDPPPDPDGAGDPGQWLPFEVGLTLGTTRLDDPYPHLRVALERNLNERRLDALSYQAGLSLAGFTVEASQRFHLPDGGTDSSSLAISYPGIVRLEATGFELIRPAWLGLPSGEPRQARYSVTLRDYPDRGQPRWQLRYSSRFDPTLATPGGEGGLRDAAIEGRVLIEDEFVGNNRFSVDLFVDVKIRDDFLPWSYLRRASLQAAADLNGTVGVQGALSYRASVAATDGRLVLSELVLDDLAVTVRATDELYLGAIFDDVWDFTGTRHDLAAFDLRPELFVVWDRCCWALMAGWDTETGQLRFSVTAPGAGTGLSQEFDTPLILPGRGSP